MAFRSPMAALRSLAVGLLRSLEVALLHTPAVGPARTAAAAAARRTPDGSWPVDDGAVVGSVCRLACRVHRHGQRCLGGVDDTPAPASECAMRWVSYDGCGEAVGAGKGGPWG